MSRWAATVRFAAAEFGPLIVFWSLAATSLPAAQPMMFAKEEALDDHHHYRL